MTLSMARCIGEAGCLDRPGTRGLCKRCYSRHLGRGTLANFPTMRERTQELYARGEVPVTATPAKRRDRASRAAASINYRERRYAERVDFDGVLVHPSSRHGHLHSYNSYGCRGAMCRATLRHYRRTGELCLSIAQRRIFTAEDCLTYVNVSGEL